MELPQSKGDEYIVMLLLLGNSLRILYELPLDKGLTLLFTHKKLPAMRV